MNAGNHYQSIKGMGVQKISNIRTQLVWDTFLYILTIGRGGGTQVGHIKQNKRGNKLPCSLSKGSIFAKITC